jgi:exopolysaccharide biosynthesis polyprenyl glycosylphosphotransferase
MKLIGGTDATGGGVSGPRDSAHSARELALSGEHALVGRRAPGSRSARHASTVDDADGVVGGPVPAVAGTTEKPSVQLRADPLRDVGGPSPRRLHWSKGYRLALVVLDLLSALLASALAFQVRFGEADHGAALGREYLVLSIVLPLGWVVVAALNRAYDTRFVGFGAIEFQRIYLSFLHLTAAVAIVSYVTKADLARGFVMIALPATLVVDLIARYAARKWLHRRRWRGEALSSMVVVGSPDRVMHLERALRRDAYAGMQVVGVCLPGGVEAAAGHPELDLPVLGGIDDLLHVVRETGADMVAVTASPEIGPEKLRWISWQLEGTSTELIVSPGLIEVAGTRLHVRPVAGLPLLHVEAPKFTGFRRLLKGVFDRFVAAMVLFLLSPLLLGIAALIRLTSTGPALFRQTRIGLNGRPFRMVKFRSMYADAEQRLDDLRGANESDGLLFKIREDPRVTPLGRVLRRYSLDELPQLVNVLTGSMSLVGPRPPLPGEVESYGDDVRRRLLVKPGLTGLWQVSGRSDLSWEDSVRLDLRYVENWSLASDIYILWKTIWAIAGTSGAY